MNVHLTVEMLHIITNNSVLSENIISSISFNSDINPRSYSGIFYNQLRSKQYL